jgi:hypothetical protein
LPIKSVWFGDTELGWDAKPADYDMGDNARLFVYLAEDERTCICGCGITWSDLKRKRGTIKIEDREPFIYCCGHGWCIYCKRPRGEGYLDGCPNCGSRPLDAMMSAQRAARVHSF